MFTYIQTETTQKWQQGHFSNSVSPLRSQGVSHAIRNTPQNSRISPKSQKRNNRKILFMQNEPNLQNRGININAVLEMFYREKSDFRAAKTNPKQTQFWPKRTQL